MDKKIIGLILFLLGVIGIVTMALTSEESEIKCKEGTERERLTKEDTVYLECVTQHEKKETYKEIGNNEIITIEKTIPKESHIENYPKLKINIAFIITLIFVVIIFITGLLILNSEIKKELK